MTEAVGAMLLSMHWVIDVDVMFIQITGYKQFC